MYKPYQSITQCKGDIISLAFKAAKIIVFDPMKCKIPVSNMNQPIENRPTFNICNSSLTHTVSHVLQNWSTQQLVIYNKGTYGILSTLHCVIKW